MKISNYKYQAPSASWRTNLIVEIYLLFVICFLELLSFRGPVRHSFNEGGFLPVLLIDNLPEGRTDTGYRLRLHSKIF